MLIKQVIIQNYRNFKKFSIELKKFNAIIGENNIGKTNFLRAINFIMNPNISYRRIILTESDFIDINKPIRVKISFSKITPFDEALFSGLITIDPITKEKSLHIEFRSKWLKKINENENECKIIREDLPEDEESREIDFYYDLRKGIPFLLIPAERIAKSEISVTRKSDFGKIIDLYAPNFISNISQLKYSIEADIKSLITKITETSTLISFLSDIKTFSDEFDTIKINLNEVKIEELDDVVKIYEKNKIRYEKLFNLIKSKLDDFDDSEKNIYEDLIEEINKKFKILCFRYERQIQLIKLKEEINDFTDFDRLNNMFDNILKTLFSDKQFNISFIPTQDENYLKKAYINIDSFPLLKHGSGTQSTFIIALKIMAFKSILERNSSQNLFIAIEEPESNCHPQLQRSLIKNIKKLQELISRTGIDIQITITTHSSNVIRSLKPQELILFRKEENFTVSLHLSDNFIKEIIDKEAIDKKWTDDQIKKNRRNINTFFWNILQYYPEAFFSKVVILGEGYTEEGFFTTFPSKIGYDLDEYNLTFLNILGKEKAYLHALLFNKFKIICIGVLDIDDQSLDEFMKLGDNFIPTNLRDFESEIVDSYPVHKILECIEFLSTKSSIENRIIALKKFDPLKNIINFGNAIEILKKNNINEKKFTDLIKKWLDSKKGLGLGRCLGERVENKDEIPTPYLEAIEKAIELSRKV